LSCESAGIEEASLARNLAFRRSLRITGAKFEKTPKTRRKTPKSPQSCRKTRKSTDEPPKSAAKPPPILISAFSPVLTGTPSKSIKNSPILGYFCADSDQNSVKRNPEIIKKPGPTRKAHSLSATTERSY